MHPLFPALIVAFAIVLVAVAVQAALHLRLRRGSDLSTAWLDLDGSARRDRWSRLSRSPGLHS